MICYERDNITIYNEDCYNIIHKLNVPISLTVLDPFYDKVDETCIVYLTYNSYKVSCANSILVWFIKMPHVYRVYSITEQFFPFINEYIWHYTDSSTYRARYMPLIEHQNILVFGNKSKVNMEVMRQDIRRPEQKKQYKSNKVRGKEAHKQYWQPNPKGNWRSSVIQIQHTPKGYMLNVDKPIGVKPTELIEIFIKGYSNKGDYILDPFMGSGSVAVACKKLGRKYIGIEIEKKYCDLAIRRLNEI